MTEWYRPANESRGQSSETNSWKIEGSLDDDLERRPRDVPTTVQDLGKYGMRGFPGFAAQERAAVQKAREMFRGTEVEMRERGYTDEQLAFQMGTPRAASAERPPERRVRTPRPQDDDDPYFNNPLEHDRDKGVIGQ